MEVLSPKATATLTVRTVFEKQSYVYQSFKKEVFTKVKLDLQKELDNGWLINRIEILEVDRQPVNWQHIK